MNNDLISREALKREIAKATYNFEQIPIRVDKVQEIIDNAPTVEPTFGVFKEMLCSECGKRPQVKVLIDGEQIYPQICGADMRGEDHD